MYELDIPQAGFPLLNKTNRYSKSFVSLPINQKNPFLPKRGAYELKL